jgi:hypothetical protein
LRVILVNPQAKRLKQNDAIRRQILERFDVEAYIICHNGIKDTGIELNRLAKECTITEIFVVGGDGTFNRVLNWVLRQDEEKRPVIISVGGGEMCYFARAQGLKSSNPVKNLEAIFSGKIRLQRTLWRPLKLYNLETKEVRHAGVIANGVVCDFIDWYEDLGKGGVLKVVFMIMIAVVHIFSESMRKRYSRLHYASGTLVFDSKHFPSVHIAFVASVFHEILPTCKPFRGNMTGDDFYTIACSRTLKRLAMVLPLVWFGKSPVGEFHNEPISRLRYASEKSRFVIDGDSVDLTSEADTQPQFVIIKGQEMIIFTVCP